MTAWARVARWASVRKFGLLGLSFVVLTSCSTTQGRYVMLEQQSLAAKPADYDVEVFVEGMPSRPFVRVSRLDAHLEKTHFIGSSLDDALPELKRQARLSGADAVIELKETTSSILETKVYHVSATGIRYTD